MIGNCNVKGGVCANMWVLPSGGFSTAGLPCLVINRPGVAGAVL